MKQTLFEQIKNSKKYKDLDDSLIKEEIKKYLKSNPNYKRYKEKKILKDIKAELHKIAGRFQINKKKKREKLLELKDYEKILETNLSTKERLSDYEKLYDSIFTYTIDLDNPGDDIYADVTFSNNHTGDYVIENVSIVNPGTNAYLTISTDGINFYEGLGPVNSSVNQTFTFFY